MENIVFEKIGIEDIEKCRGLCDELMAFQKSKAKIEPEVFDMMNFDTRMKKSCENALDIHVVLVEIDDVPVGYVFSSIENIYSGDKSEIPNWTPPDGADNWLGFYPEWDNLPAKCGCLNNTYLKDKYRNKGLGSKLFEMTMDWMKNYPGIDLIFVYISNGNDEAMDFYLKHGFTYSHDVFGGFIKAAYCRVGE